MKQKVLGLRQSACDHGRRSCPRSSYYTLCSTHAWSYVVNKSESKQGGDGVVLGRLNCGVSLSSLVRVGRAKS